MHNKAHTGTGEKQKSHKDVKTHVKDQCTTRKQNLRAEMNEDVKDRKIGDAVKNPEIKIGCQG